jgi:hypothetical protein
MSSTLLNKSDVILRTKSRTKQISMLGTELDKKFLLTLSKEIEIYILEFAGYHKLRNGKYIVQLPKNMTIIKKLLMKRKIMVDRTYSTVELPIMTKWFRRAFCDKIITLFVEINEYEYDEDYRVIRFYDCGWYEYDYDESLHRLTYEEYCNW